MNIEGKIIHIGETETVGSAGTFKKRLLVVKSNEEYPQEIPIDFVQAKTDLLDKYVTGQDVSVSINIRGNSYNGKWYCSLNGWRIERTSGAEEPVVNYTLQGEKLGQDETDLPF